MRRKAWTGERMDHPGGIDRQHRADGIRDEGLRLDAQARRRIHQRVTLGDHLENDVLKL